MKSIMIQGTSSAAGKTTISAALCRIFNDLGYSVAPFKSQNMSRMSYVESDFEISVAQAIQAIAARCDISPNLNPILLKPLGDYTSIVYLDGKPYKEMHADEYYANFIDTALTHATRSLKLLYNTFDIVILEGAGSPAEINLQQYDIANMKMADEISAAVILVSDIDRGGAFASIVGTMSLIDHRELVQGFILNKFRGDIKILEPGYTKLEQITGSPVLGTIPLIHTGLPEEDSMGTGLRKLEWRSEDISVFDSKLDRLADIVRSNIDMTKIEEIIQ